MVAKLKRDSVLAMKQAGQDRAEIVREYGLPSIRLHENLPGYSKDNLFLHCRDMIQLSSYVYEHSGIQQYLEGNDKRWWNPLDWFRSMNNDPENKEILETLKKPGLLGPILKAINKGVQNDILKRDADVQDAIEMLKQDLKDTDVDTTDFLHESELIKFHCDHDDVKRSCVWALLKNDKLKRVTVVFRGSTTKWDWLTNFTGFLKYLPNPVDKTSVVVGIQCSEWPENIDIHMGFAHAALGQIGKILNEIAIVMEENEGYRLFVTGHSLGGALATIVAFHAAADKAKRFIKTSPVMLYSVASPRCGGQKFHEMFKVLEENGKLRHARLYNHKDRVPMLPYLNGYYKHVGLGIAFRSSTLKLPPILDYPSYSRWQKRGMPLLDNLSSLLDAISYHSYAKTRSRLVFYIKQFSKMSLEQEYHNVWGLHNANSNLVTVPMRKSMIENQVNYSSIVE